MISSFFRSLLLFGCLAVGPAAQAAILFSDDFSANTPAAKTLPFGWSIANGGSIDILGQCNSRIFDDLLPGNTCYIDLDGGTGVNGVLTKSLFLPAGHTYTALFDLAGNNRPWPPSDPTSPPPDPGDIGVWPFPDVVAATFGSTQQDFELAPDDNFATFQLSFTPVASGTYTLSFVNSNIDGYGALLDNIRIQQVPGPLPLFGAAAAFGVSRRLRGRDQRRKR